MNRQKKTAIIVGSEGQDGKLLFDLLASLGYAIIGIDKQSIRTNKIKWGEKININNKEEVFDLIKKNKPQEIYHLAAFLFSSQEKRDDFYNDLQMSYQINVFSLINFLEGVRLFSKKTKLFYASSSLIFGNCSAKKQTESTPLNPNSLYGLTKMDGTLLCRLYREKYNMFVSTGIMYNHESKYRGDNFISMKIIKGAKNIATGKQKILSVGDLYATVDWGYAPDYVKAMQMILGLKTPDEFIISSNQAHAVLDFIKITFKKFHIDWEKHVKEDKQIISVKRSILIGDNNKLKNATGWKPSVNFSGMINKIIKDLEK